MSALAQLENRTTRRNEFKRDESTPSRREIYSCTASVRENWTGGEKQFRYQLAQLLQQQLLDKITSLPHTASEKGARQEVRLA
ncbi:MAG: hypothetical protein ACKVP0_02570 [Pirellulaceae bacterium]